MATAQEAQYSAPPEDFDWVARARAVAPIIKEDAAAGEAQGRVTDRVMTAMHDAGLFRLSLPRSIGGPEAPPLTAMRVLEVVSNADASTAWCLGQALGTSRLAGYVDQAVAREIYGSPDAVLAWGPEKGETRAVRTEGGYRVSGEWMYGSGVRNATWVGAHCKVFEPDGTPVMEPGGAQLVLTMLLPIAKARIIDVWQVMGLRATGSDSYIIEDAFVPEGFAFKRDSADYRREMGPLYSLQINTFFSVGFAGVALGVARGGLDDFIETAKSKVAQYTTGTLRENAAMQQKIAHTEALVRSARAYVVEQATRVWEALCRDEELTMDMRVQLRIACSNAMIQARDAVQFAYYAAGASAILERYPFERRFRDMNSVTQQVQSQPVNFENAGRVLFGLDQHGRRF